MLKRATGFALAALMSACASAPAATGDASALRGCWIERRGEQTITQRWFPKAGGVWQGDEITYFKEGDPEPGRWKLAPGGESAPFSMCMVELNMMSAPPCWRAFFGPGKPDGDNTRWVEIEATPETLKITYITAPGPLDGPASASPAFAAPDRFVTFNGARDGCD